MSKLSKTLLLSAALVAVFGAVLILGGSMVWMVGGAHGLNIDGAATRTPRPTDTIDVGSGWGAYGGDPGGHRYSQARQITPGNVHRLALAWQYRTGDMTARAAHMERAATEGTPILVGDALILCTPFNEVIALDAGTGEERWRFDPQIDLGQDPANQFICRGVAHWRDDDAAGACASRIFTGTNDARLIAVDAATGQRCAGFGDGGEVRIDPGMPLLWPGEFQITSPPATVGDVVVIGSAIGDNARVVAPAGSVRAFDARTGAPRWDWDPIPRTGDNPAAPTWEGDASAPRRPCQRLGTHGSGRAARACLCSHQQPEPGLLRRPAAGQQPPRQFGGRARRGHRKRALELPDRAPRHLGLRRAGATGPVLGLAGRPPARRGGAGDQNGLRVRPGPRHRRALPAR